MPRKYVNYAATGLNNGTSWANAYTDLQSALGVSLSSADEIWVAQGTYKPSVCWDVVTGTQIMACPSGTRTASFKIPDGAKVYGGFNGSETALDQRNLSVNITILSGDIGAVGSEAYHVTFFYNCSSNTVLSGFTITDGNANASFPLNVGGGTYNNTSSPNISECTFQNNKTGGGGGAGGAFFANENSAPSFVGCLFENNSSSNGGAVSNNNASSSFLKCTFKNNSSTTHGGAINNDYSSDNNNRPSFDDCIFIDNTSTTDGGVFWNSNTRVMCNSCIFDGNTSSASGGVMYNNGSNNSGPSIFTNCVFYNNSASTTGGAIYNFASSPSFTNVTFYNNNATNNGRVMQSRTVFPYFDPAAPVILNSILWDEFSSSSADLIVNEDQAVTTATYSDVLGGFTGVGNINIDPLFINTANVIGPDNIWITADDGLALQPCSLCIAAGNTVGAPATDILGNIRPTPPSMGAYEVPTFTITPASLSVCKDNNNDTLTVNGINNESILWQLSLDGITWLNTDVVTTEYTFENLKSNTFLRAMLTTSDCINNPIFSTISTIFVADCHKCPTVRIIPDTLADIRVGQKYRQKLILKNGIGSAVWSKIAGSFPPGITLSAEAGILSGRATAAGNYKFTIASSDSCISNEPISASTVTQEFSLTVLDVPAPIPVPSPRVITSSSVIINANFTYDWVITTTVHSVQIDLRSLNVHK